MDRRYFRKVLLYRKISRSNLLAPPSSLASFGPRRRLYSNTLIGRNKHGETLLEYLRENGALELDHGPIRIQATRYCPENDTRTVEDGDPDTKIIHFQRHGQAYHNLMYGVLSDAGAPVLDVYEPNPAKNPFVRPEMVDAPLTEFGRLQCKDKRAAASKLNPEILIVSPLHRALQTARISFLDFQGKIPFLAHEGCREELGLLVCNKRRPLSETIEDYPNIDFSIVAETAEEEDRLWDPKRRECPIAKSKRIYDFLTKFVSRRPEKEIVIVGHSAWLFSMCHTVLDCGNDNGLKEWFGASDIRSMRLRFSKKE